jgi:hypothetical protein
MLAYIPYMHPMGYLIYFADLVVQKAQIY